MFTLGSILGHTKLLALAGVTAASLAVAPTAVKALQANHNPDATRPDPANFDNSQYDAAHQDNDRGADHSNFVRQNGDRDGFSPYGNPGIGNDRPDFRRQDPRDFRRSDGGRDQRFHPLSLGRSQDRFTCNITFTRSHHRG